MTTLQFVFTLLAWALIFGPLFLLWWLPGHRCRDTVKPRRSEQKPAGVRSVGSEPSGAPDD